MPNRVNALCTILISIINITSLICLFLHLCAGDRRVPSYLAYVVRPDDPVLQDRPGPELGARRTNVDALQGV